MIPTKSASCRGGRSLGTRGRGVLADGEQPRVVDLVARPRGRPGASSRPWRGRAWPVGQHHQRVVGHQLAVELVARAVAECVPPATTMGGARRSAWRRPSGHGRRHRTTVGPGSPRSLTPTGRPGTGPGPPAGGGPGVSRRRPARTAPPPRPGPPPRRTRRRGRKDVGDRLDADGEPHQPGRDPGGQPVLVGRPGCASSTPGGWPAAHVADVRHMAVQRRGPRRSGAGLQAAGDLEGEDGTGALRGVLLGAGPCTGWTAGPARSTCGWVSRIAATRRAFSTCRSIRRLSVSRPWASRKALNGEIAGPRSRSNCTRALRTNARLAPSGLPTPRSRA